MKAWEPCLYLQFEKYTSFTFPSERYKRCSHEGSAMGVVDQSPYEQIYPYLIRRIFAFTQEIWFSWKSCQLEKNNKKKNKKCLYPKRAPECFSIYAFAQPLTWTSTARHRIVWFKESLKFNIAYLFEIHSRLWWNFSIFVFALFFFSHETSH